VTDDGFIRVPARTRAEIGELALYLEQGLRSLRQVTEHLRGSSGTMPSVLDDLRDVMRMTEAATERVLDETEALVADGRTATRLLGDVRRLAGGPAMTGPVQELGALIERANGRAMEIMSALEFQDLAAQKVQRTFAVLEETLVRLTKIQRLVDVGGAETPSPGPPTLRARSDSAPSASADGARGGSAAQRLADELLLHYAADMDV
jgi:chemotaxis regulatin CheY-phosphate phosphatase CheZ